MREKEEVRRVYEEFKDDLESEKIGNDEVRELLTRYKRALGWVLEDDYF